jgi:Rad3-related DNA helicase
MALITATEQLHRQAAERLKPLLADGTVRKFDVVTLSGRATLEVLVAIQTNPTAASFDKREFERVVARLRTALGGLQWRLASSAGQGGRPRQQDSTR